jgi:hypothetical protein
MFDKWLSTIGRKARQSIARSAAAGTYEAIRHATIYGRPESRTDAEKQMLNALAARRSWRRLDAKTFVVRWRSREATLTVDRPLNPTRFFCAVAAAEIGVFCAETDPDQMGRFQGIGREELRRLFTRDGLPWDDSEDSE